MTNNRYDSYRLHIKVLCGIFALVRITLQLHMFLFLADVMKSKGANTVIAVDVGSEYPAELTNYGDHLSGWWLLWKKWNPFGEKIYVSAMWYGIVLCCAVQCSTVLWQNAKESMSHLPFQSS